MKKLLFTLTAVLLVPSVCSAAAVKLGASVSAGTSALNEIQGKDNNSASDKKMEGDENKGAYVLSNGTVVDAENTGDGGPNGIVAEDRCVAIGKRLPTLTELREMYQKRAEIGNLTNGADAGGWPYWSERTTRNDPRGQGDYGSIIVFSGGFYGSLGSERAQPFWGSSGYGGYVRCVKSPAVAEENNSFTLSNGTIVDGQNTGDGGPNGIVAEDRCVAIGKRLPTLTELREMYQKRDQIGNFTNGADMGGWPYWSERTTHNDPRGQNDQGWRIIFAGGAFGSQGEEQLRAFWGSSGVGAYVRCVKSPAASTGFRLSNGTIVDKENISGGSNGIYGEDNCKAVGKRLPTLSELREMYQKKDQIGNFTNVYDMGGWPYWSQRTTQNDARGNGDKAWRIIFAGGSFGWSGEEQLVDFWSSSGYGAYTRCVK